MAGWVRQIAVCTCVVVVLGGASACARADDRAVQESTTMPQQQNPNPMQLGADDAGKRRQVYEDPNMRAAFEQMGFSFLMHHIQGRERADDVRRLVEWAERTNHGFILNQENTSRPPAADGLYDKGGYFFQPPAELIAEARKSQHFLGVCYDEAEHWATNGVWITGGRADKTFVPHFYDAEGGTLDQAYEGNLRNLRTLLKTHYAGFSPTTTGRGPIVSTEHVFPTFFHVFARAGITPIPKYLKETVTPVHAAMAMGAAKQYGTDYWACLDLWGPASGWPGHTPRELASSMLFAYWTGATHAYVENINYRDSLYKVADGAVSLTEWGKVAQWFNREYMGQHPRDIRIADFAPETIIVRFPDSDWGQTERSYIRDALYGASNLKPDDQTRYWFNIWHVISHGQIPAAGLTWHADLRIPFRFFFPANNVAVYDHLADKPELYAAARLVFLTGKQIPKPTMDALLAVTERNGTLIVTPSHLAPAGMVLPGGHAMAEHAVGAGAVLVTDDVTAEPVRARLAPLLGRPDELRYVFGKREVVFTAPAGPDQIEIVVRPVRP